MPGRDIYWNNTSLLVNGNTATGSGGWDAGPNRLDVTTVGNPQRDAASPFQSAPGYWSNSFDGNGDYLTVLSATALQLPTQDFTIECWAYLTVAPADQSISVLVQKGTGANNNTEYQLSVFNNNGTLQVRAGYTTDGTTFVVNQLGSISLNTWNHIAVTRVGTVLTIWINGVSAGTLSWTDTQYAGSGSLGMGGSSAGLSLWNGYISNLRIVKGTAVYTANFTPPTTPLTAIANTVLLTCQDNRFKDNSTNNFTITATGNVSVEPESPFRGGSVYFDGGYLSLAGSTALDLSSTPFTVEYWINPTQASFAMIYHHGSQFRIYYLNGYMSIVTGGSLQWTSDTTVYELNKWSHYAVTYNGSSTFVVYKNGTQIGTFSASTASDSSTITYIASQSPNSAQLYGYLSNLRVVKGTAVYTTNFTPPGNELTPIANTVLLTCQSPTQLVDYSTNNFAITSSGNATVSNAGPGLLSRKNSVYFDGSGDYLRPQGKITFTGDFTIEAWVYRKVSSTVYDGIFCLEANGDWNTSGSGLAIGCGNFHTAYATMGTNYSSSIPLNSWTHIACTRSGSSIKVFLNGSQVASITGSGTLGSQAGNFPAIGVFDSASGGGRYPFIGYISNLRVLTGTALYTANFTPSKKPLEAITNTSLLTCQSETIEDTGPNNLPITITGTPFTSQFNPYDITRNTYGSVLVSRNLAGENRFYTQTFDNMAPGTGDFTLECWVNPMYLLGGAANRFLQISSKSSGGFFLTFYVSSWFRIEYDNTAGYIDGTANYIKLNQWNHIAFVRTNGVSKLFVDGVQQGSDKADTTSYDFNRIIINNYGTQALDGFISNIRYSKTARYTTTFTPSLTPFQPDSNTVTLLAGTSEITPRNKVFTDYSNNALSITASNVTQSALSPYTTRNGQDYSPLINGGSVYFNPGNSLQTGSSSGFTFGTGDYTIEFWIRMGQLGQNIGPILQVGTWSIGNIWLSMNYSNSILVTEGVTTVATTTSTMKIGIWNHIAVCRSNGILNIYVNGVLDKSVASTYNISATTVTFNHDMLAYCYISDFRVVKGKAVYQTNFPVPTQPVGLYSLNNATTTLYLPFTSASIIDETGKNSIEPVGDVKSSTLIKKYNNTSMYFDGNGDYLKLSDNSVCQFGTGDYTVECWFNLNTTNISYPRIIALGNVNTSGNFQIELNPAAIRIHNNTTYPSLSYSWTAGDWYHLAVVRISGTLKVFINGTILYTGATNYTSTVNSTGALTIGSSDGSNWFNGYIDDLRITKGIARYTANFTVPSTNLPTAEVYTQPVVTNYQDNGTDLGTKYVTKSYLMDWYSDLIPSLIDNTLLGSGGNTYGQLGDGTTTSRSSPSSIIGGGSWKSITFQWKSANGIKSDGTLWSWGDNSKGQLGDGTTSSRLSPVTTVGGGTNWKQVSGGNSSNFCAAIKTDGTLWTWGDNIGGDLGDGTTSSRSSPVTTAGGGTNWKQVSAGAYFTTAVKTDGTLWVWGVNDYTQLGDGTSSNRSSPVTTVGGGTNWKQVSAGGRCWAAIKTDGTLWTNGYNIYGQLGDGTTSTRSSPVTTAGGGVDWKKVACGYDCVAAIKSDGTLWTWGSNLRGQLGDGTTSSRSSPVTTTGGGTNWKSIYCSGGTILNTTMAIKTDGTLWGWGNNNNGQLGLNNTTNYSSPMQLVVYGTNVREVALQCSNDYGSFVITSL